MIWVIFYAGGLIQLSLGKNQIVTFVPSDIQNLEIAKKTKSNFYFLLELKMCSHGCATRGKLACFDTIRKNYLLLKHTRLIHNLSQCKSIIFSRHFSLLLNRGWLDWNLLPHDK